jgi:hypothetical protein
MLGAIVVSAAWAATSKPILIPSDGHRPQIVAQNQAGDSIQRDHISKPVPPGLEDSAGEKEGEKGGHNAPEVTFLGVKPGEWLLTIATFSLWYATMRLVWDARETSKRQLRAYVTVQDLKLESVATGVRAGLIWENTGQTPARKVRTFTSFALFDPAAPPSFDYVTEYTDPSEVESQLVLGPKQITINSLGIVSHQEIAAIGQGTVKAFVWGWMEYDDIYGKKRHRTEAAYWLIVEGGNPPTGIRANRHSEFNGMDDDCKKPVET